MQTDLIKYLKNLERPSGKVDVVFDTDTYNEIDDQYALAYLIRSGEKLRIKAIHAAPFLNRKVKTPQEGMELSHSEILHILSLMNREDLTSLVHKGSERFLPSEVKAVPSEAAENLARLAMAYSVDNPLYVVAVGAITNVASALLTRPEIASHMVIVWLGGHALDWHDNREFNLFQDVAAARVVLGCGAPLVLLPCMGVVSSFRTSGPELEYWLRDKNKLCNYLVDATIAEALADQDGNCWTRAIWDVTAVAWLLDGDFMLDRLEHSPIPEYDGRYAFDKTRHLIRYVYHIKRDKLFEDLFIKLSSC